MARKALEQVSLREQYEKISAVLIDEIRSNNLSLIKHFLYYTF
jgi:hypothetical protein